MSLVWLFLHDLTIDPALDLQVIGISYLICCGDLGTAGAEGVKAFSLYPLAGASMFLPPPG
jgi:hypothetical protein